MQQVATNMFRVNLSCKNPVKPRMPDKMGSTFAADVNMSTVAFDKMCIAPAMYTQPLESTDVKFRTNDASLGQGKSTSIRIGELDPAEHTTVQHNVRPNSDSNQSFGFEFGRFQIQECCPRVERRCALPGRTSVLTCRPPAKAWLGPPFSQTTNRNLHTAR
jgi:hypothetical protein